MSNKPVIKQRKKKKSAKRRRMRKIHLLCKTFITVAATMLILFLFLQEIGVMEFVHALPHPIRNEESQFIQLKKQISSEVLEAPSPEIEIDMENINSPYGILMDAKSGKILAKHNEKEKIYPASLTKIMTAILVIENKENLGEKIILPEQIFNSLYLQNASMAGFQPNEEVTVKDLLYGILLPSGAECCMALVDAVAGSESSFVDLMNQKAKDLGMENTHFCNSTGLHEDNHYSTTEDIAILLEYALQNEIFKTIFCSRRYSVPPSNLHPEGFTMCSTMFGNMDNIEVTGGNLMGGKTGYTKEAGQCLASLADINGGEYILVTAKAQGTHQTQQYHILDAINIYDQIGRQHLNKR